MARNQSVSVRDEGDKGSTIEPVAEPRSRAAVRFGWGRARFEAEVDVTPTTLLAIGGMVGMILLSIAPIVEAAGKPGRGR